MGNNHFSNDLGDWFTTRKSIDEKTVIIDEDWFHGLDTQYGYAANENQWWGLVHYLDTTLGQGNWWINEQES